MKGTGHLCHIAPIQPRKAKKRAAATAALDGEAAEGNELLEGEGEDDPDDLEALIRQMEIDDGEKPIEDEPEAAPYSIIPFDFEASSLLSCLLAVVNFSFLLLFRRRSRCRLERTDWDPSTAMSPTPAWLTRSATTARIAPSIHPVASAETADE